MLNTVKTNAKNFIKTLVDALHRDRRFNEDRLSAVLVERMLDGLGDTTTINLPSHYLQFCFDLVSRTRVEVERVKWNSDRQDLGFKRFDRFLQSLDNGLPGYDVALAEQVLGVSNELSGNYREMPESGLDVAHYFVISSSFAFKGKLLFNAIRFMRPRHCVEIGTAFGMSGMFSLQALEKLEENGRLWTIEAADIQYATSSALLKDRFGDRVSCLHGMSTDCLPSVIQEADDIDFYFHDGGHHFDNIVDNFQQVKPHLRSGSIVLIDDIRWWDKRLLDEDPRCYAAWKQIADDESVRCAVEVNNGIGIALIG